MADGSGELAGAARGDTGGAVRFTSGRETALYMRAAASSCTPADAEAGTTPQTSTGARDRGRADDGPVGKGRARPSANPEAPRGGPDPEGGLGVRNAWGRSGPRLARDSKSEARAAQTWRRRGARRRAAVRRGAERPIHFTVPWFRRVYLQNFELKCTMWSIGKL
jgi:hypothetical protein